MTIKAIEILVCFKDKLKNTYITVATDVSEARRIARIRGGNKEGEPVMRTIFKREVSFPDEKPEIVDGVKVWPASF